MGTSSSVVCVACGVISITPLNVKNANLTLEEVSALTLIRHPSHLEQPRAEIVHVKRRVGGRDRMLPKLPAAAHGAQLKVTTLSEPVATGGGQEDARRVAQRLEHREQRVE